jgi:hypothetical protein
MSRLLPTVANGRFLQEQAKDILKAQKRGSAEVCDSLRLLHRFAKASDREILSAEVALHEAQFALAMDYGFKSWDALVKHVRSVESDLAREESLVVPESLAETLDAVNEALFFERPISRARREEAALWIAGRQGLPWSYFNSFAPTERDLKEGAISLFTGEKIASGGGRMHILGEEACRTLQLLGVRNGEAGAAHERAVGSFNQAFRGCVERNPGRDVGWGFFCCYTCSCSLWRNLASGALEHAEERMEAGVGHLRARRDGSGRWRGYPFYYALLALTEMEAPGAREEMRYAAPGVERCLKRLQGEEKVTRRRREVAERVLRQIG